jgi:hypothetical protein
MAEEAGVLWASLAVDTATFESDLGRAQSTATRAWGFGNEDYYGCLRYHGCG